MRQVQCEVWISVYQRGEATGVAEPVLTSSLRTGRSAVANGEYERESHNLAAAVVAISSGSNEGKKTSVIL